MGVPICVNQNILSKCTHYQYFCFSDMGTYQKDSSDRSVLNMSQQSSLDGGQSVITSQSASTFDEVESIDFNGSHEVDFLHDENAHTYKNSHLSRNSKVSRRKNSRGNSSSSGSLQDSYTESLRLKSRGRDLIAPDDSNELPYARHQKMGPEEAVAAAGTPHAYDYPLGGKSEVYRNFLEQFSDPKHNIYSTSTESFSTSLSSMSGEPPIKYPYENDYEYHVRKRRISTSSTASGSHSIPPLKNANKLTSFDSTTSSSYSGKVMIMYSVFNYLYYGIFFVLCYV